MWNCSVPRSDRFALTALCLLCLLPRVAILWRHSADLLDDRDHYIAIAEGIREGRGFSIPGGSTPSAYRPPLYPLILSAIPPDHLRLGIALLQLGAALGTVLLIWKTAGNLGLSPAARWLGAALFCIDPLSLRYIAFPMTEITSAFLVALVLCLITGSSPRGSHPGIRAFFTGVAFGLCVLCRPTFWAFGGLYAVAWLMQAWRDRHLLQNNGRSTSLVKRVTCAALGIALCVAPWTWRNWRELGSPIFTTTHGGYTLLLGNNEAFYREVVDQPWGTVWDGSHGPGQAGWFDRINAEMDAEGKTSEVQRDRWMSARAQETIRREPVTFLRACWLKFTWFWNVTGHAPSVGGLPRPVIWGVGAYYMLLWGALLLGTVRLCLNGLRRPATPVTESTGFRWPVLATTPLQVAALLLIIASTSGVHLIYWSDARMRAPIMPAIVLVAAAALPGRRRIAGSANAADSAGP